MYDLGEKGWSGIEYDVLIFILFFGVEEVQAGSGHVWFNPFKQWPEDYLATLEVCIGTVSAIVETACFVMNLWQQHIRNNVL